MCVCNININLLFHFEILRLVWNEKELAKIQYISWGYRISKFCETIFIYRFFFLRIVLLHWAKILICWNLDQFLLQHAFTHAWRLKKSKEIKNIFTITAPTRGNPNIAGSIPVGSRVMKNIGFILIFSYKFSRAELWCCRLFVLFICADVGFRLLSIL